MINMMGKLFRVVSWIVASGQRRSTNSHEIKRKKRKGLWTAG